MANGGNIKGITIEINGETKGLNASLADVNKRTGDVAKELKDVERLLKFNPGNTEVIAQKQQLLAQQITNTTETLDRLKGAEAQVQAQFAKGDIGEEQYRGFRRELIRAESQLAGFQDKLQQTGADSGIDEAAEELKALSMRSQELVTDLKEIDNALKLDPGNVELITQKQRVLGEQAQMATQGLQGLKDAQAEVEAQFARGDMGQAEYDRFKREIIATELRVESLDNTIRELGGDTELDEVEAALIAASKRGEELVKDLKEIDDALKLDPGNLDLIEQKQRNLAEQSQRVTKELQDLRDAQADVDAQFARGDMGQAEYDRFRRDIIKAESAVKSLNDEIDDLGKVNQVDEVAEALKAVSKRSDELVKDLKEIDDALKLDPGNVDLVAQKQRALGEQSQIAANKLRGLKDAQADVEAQFARGDMGQAEYDRFNRDIISTELRLKSLDDQIRDVGSETQIAEAAEELRAVSKRSDELVNDLKEIDEALKLKPGNTDLIAQKQRVLGEQAQIAAQKLQRLKDAQADVEAQFARGDMGRAEFDRFQRDIISTETRLQGLNEEIRQIGDGSSISRVRGELEDIRNSADRAEGAVGGLGSALGGLAAGAGAKGAIDAALESSSLNTSIKIGFDVPDESIDAVRAAIRGVTAYGVDAEAALEGVRRQFAMNADASDEMNQNIAAGAAHMVRAYAGLDFTELIQETNEIASELGISNEEALALTDALMKSSFPPDQIDIIAEYGAQLHEAGYNASQVQAIMASAAKTKSWNIDNLLDGLKEGRIKLTEFGLEIPKALGELLEKTDISAEQMTKWGQAVAAGGEAGTIAMEESALALAAITDEAVKNEIGIALYGTKWEDQGAKIIASLTGVSSELRTTEENKKAFDAAMEAGKEDPMFQLRESLGLMKAALAPILEDVAKLITLIATWVSENPELAATIVAVLTVLGTLSGALLLLSPLFGTIVSIMKITAVVIGGLNAPILLAIAAIGLLVAAGVGLYQNWDTVSEKAQSVFQSIEQFISGTMNSVSKTITEILDSIDQKTNGAFSSITNTIRDALEKAKEIVRLTLEYMKETFTNGLQVVKDILNGNFSDAYDGVKTHMDNVKDYITNIMDTIQEFLRGIDLFEIGSDIIRGLMNGIVSKEGGVLGAIGKLIGGLVGKSEDDLEIHSPSRVFDRIGRFTGEGLEQGLLAMGARVARASAKLTANTLVDPNTDVTLGDVNGVGGSRAGASGTSGGDNFVMNFAGAVFNVRSDDDIVQIGREFQRRIDIAKKGQGG